MVQIPRGGIGQADLTWQGCQDFWAANWTIFRVPLALEGNQGGYDDDTPFSGEANGWLGAAGGIVTVPVDAVPGFYVLERFKWTDLCPPAEGGYVSYRYEFEVTNEIIYPPGPGYPICEF